MLLPFPFIYEILTPGLCGNVVLSPFSVQCLLRLIGYSHCYLLTKSANITKIDTIVVIGVAVVAPADIEL